MIDKVEIDHDENLHVDIVLTFKGKVYAAQMTFDKNQKKIENVKTQINGMATTTVRNLLKKGIISE